MSTEETRDTLFESAKPNAATQPHLGPKPAPEEASFGQKFGAGRKLAMAYDDIAQDMGASGAFKEDGFNLLDKENEEFALELMREFGLEERDITYLHRKSQGKDKNAARYFASAIAEEKKREQELFSGGMAEGFGMALLGGMFNEENAAITAGATAVGGFFGTAGGAAASAARGVSNAASAGRRAWRNIKIAGLTNGAYEAITYPYRPTGRLEDIAYGALFGAGFAAGIEGVKALPRAIRMENSRINRQFSAINQRVREAVRREQGETEGAPATTSTNNRIVDEDGAFRHGFLNDVLGDRDVPREDLEANQRALERARELLEQDTRLAAEAEAESIQTGVDPEPINRALKEWNNETREKVAKARKAKEKLQELDDPKKAEALARKSPKVREAEAKAKEEAEAAAEEKSIVGTAEIDPKVVEEAVGMRAELQGLADENLATLRGQIKGSDGPLLQPYEDAYQAVGDLISAVERQDYDEYYRIRRVIRNEHIIYIDWQTQNLFHRLSDIRPERSRSKKEKAEAEERTLSSLQERRDLLQRRTSAPIDEEIPEVEVLRSLREDLVEMSSRGDTYFTAEVKLEALNSFERIISLSKSIFDHYGSKETSERWVDQLLGTIQELTSKARSPVQQYKQLILRDNFPTKRYPDGKPFEQLTERQRTKYFKELESDENLITYKVIDAEAMVKLLDIIEEHVPKMVSDRTIAAQKSREKDLRDLEKIEREIGFAQHRLRELERSKEVGPATPKAPTVDPQAVKAEFFERTRAKRQKELEKAKEELRAHRKARSEYIRKHVTGEEGTPKRDPQEETLGFTTHKDLMAELKQRYGSDDPEVLKDKVTDEELNAIFVSLDRAEDLNRVDLKQINSLLDEVALFRYGDEVTEIVREPRTQEEMFAHAMEQTQGDVFASLARTRFGIDLRWSAGAQLRSSPFQIVRALGIEMSPDRVALRTKDGEHVVQRETIEELASRLSQSWEIRLNREYNHAFKKWLDGHSDLKSRTSRFTGIGYYDKLQEFSEMVTDAVRFDDVNQRSPAEVQQAAAVIREINAEILETMKVAGVKGFENVDKNPNYIPRLYTAQSIANFIQRFGVEGMEEMWAEGFKRAQMGLNENQIKHLSKRITDGIVRSKLVGEVSVTRALEGDPEELRALLSSKEIDLDPELRELVVQRVEQKAKEAAEANGSPLTSRAKRRALVDEDTTLLMTDRITGESRQVRFTEMAEGNALDIMHQYIRQSAGAAAFAERGIKSRTDWETVINLVRKEAEQSARVTGVDQQRELNKALENLDYIHKRVLGIPLQDPASVGSIVADRILKYNFIRLMGQAGFAQIAELWSMSAEIGVRTMIKVVPSLRSLVRNPETGQIDDELVASIQLQTGLAGIMDRNFGGYRGGSTETLNSQQPVRSRLMDRTDRMLAFGQVLVSNASMAPVNHFLQTMGIKGIAYKWTKFAKEGIPDADRRRMRYQGLTDRDIDRVLESIRTHTEYDANGFPKNLRMDLWDPEIRERFSGTFRRHARTMVAEPLASEVHRWMGSNLGRVFMQFRSFVFWSWEGSLLRGVDKIIHDKDMSMFSIWAASSAGAMVGYTGQTALNSIGPNQSEYLEERLTTEKLIGAGFSRSVWASWLPVVAATFVPGMEEHVSRSSGSAVGGLAQFPALGLVMSTEGVWKSIAGVLSGEEEELTASDLRRIRRIFMGQNLPIISNLAAIPERNAED